MISFHNSPITIKYANIFISGIANRRLSSR